MGDSSLSRPTDPRLLRLTPEDNVSVVTTTIQAGESLMIDGVPVTVADCVPRGHKLALVPIVAGRKVVKYGAPIGTATCDIEPGQHVHLHNLRSDYLPTYTPDAPAPI